MESEQRREMNEIPGDILVLKIDDAATVVIAFSCTC
jgi:hypothetical protein